MEYHQLQLWTPYIIPHFYNLSVIRIEADCSNFGEDLVLVLSGPASSEIFANFPSAMNLGGRREGTVGGGVTLIWGWEAEWKHSGFKKIKLKQRHGEK
jgi:hypothetical protein